MVIKCVRSVCGLWNSNRLLYRCEKNLYRLFCNDTPLPANNVEEEVVVILGTGWGSYSVLKNIDRKKYKVKVISPRNYFLFTPLLCSTTVGTLEFRSIIAPVRNIGFKETSDFHLANAVAVNIPQKTISCESVVNPNLKYEIKYDKLVIGVGALNNTFGVPGVLEHAVFLKELIHARTIRNRIIGNFELALEPGLSDDERNRLLHTVIVGGGPTGVEFGAELYDFKQQDVFRHYKQEEKNVKVTLVESNQILSSFDARLRAYAEKKLSNREGFNLIKSSVTEVKNDRVLLKDGRELPCGLVVWSTGIAPQEFTRNLDVPKSAHGQILTDSYLKVLGDPSGSVYALGDCACIEKMPLPATAQVAERKGRYVALCLNKDRKPQEFRFKSLGMLTYIGGYRALFDFTNLKLQGFTSWFLWRSAYLTTLGSWRLRMQVPLDWTKTLIFGRDISRF